MESRNEQKRLIGDELLESILAIQRQTVAESGAASLPFRIGSTLKGDFSEGLVKFS